MSSGLSEINRAASHTVATALAPRNPANSVGSASKPSNGTSTMAAKSNATPAATGTSSTASSTDSAATITSSDFLTLLVGELKNQDPTQPTDPNAYITQLVGVNSLEQLISINSGISSLDSAASAASTTGHAKPVAGS
jgi:flagellar basal-body rod modification protein FlgD